MSAVSWVLQSTMPKMASSIWRAVNALKGFGGRSLAVVNDLDGDTNCAVHAVASLA